MQSIGGFQIGYACYLLSIRDADMLSFCSNILDVVSYEAKGDRCNDGRIGVVSNV